MAAAACGIAGPGPADAQKPIRIGASLSLTGTDAELGRALQRVDQLDVKHANAKGGVLGRPIERQVQWARRQEGHRLAGRAGSRQAARPHAAVAAASMRAR